MRQGKIHIAPLSTVIFCRRRYTADSFTRIHISIFLDGNLRQLSVSGLIAVSQIQRHGLADLLIFKIEVTFPCAQAVTVMPSSAEKIVAGLYLY